MVIALGADPKALFQGFIVEHLGAALAFGPEAVGDIFFLDAHDGIFWLSKECHNLLGAQVVGVFVNYQPR